MDEVAAGAGVAFAGAAPLDEGSIAAGVLVADDGGGAAEEGAPLDADGAPESIPGGEGARRRKKYTATARSAANTKMSAMAARRCCGVSADSLGGPRNDDRDSGEGGVCRSAECGFDGVCRSAESGVAGVLCSDAFVGGFDGVWRSASSRGDDGAGCGN